MNTSRLAISTVVALAAGTAASFGIGSGTLLSLLTQTTIHAIFALGVGLLLKQNGMVSFGHALYFGSAGYLVAIMLQSQTVPAELAIPITVLGLMLLAFLVGLVVVRVPGIAFGMLTLAVGQMVFLTASRTRGLTGGADGMTIEWPSVLFGVPASVLFEPSTMLLVNWSTLVLMLLGLALVLRGRFGAITEAVRDNEERARFIGIRTLVPRAAIYALSAGVTAVAGVLGALNTGFVSPESLHWGFSGVALTMVVIGGTRVLWGPALGAAAYFLVKEMLGDHGQHGMAIFGITLIAVVVFAPEGLSGLLLRFSRHRSAASAPVAPHPSARSAQ